MDHYFTVQKNLLKKSYKGIHGESQNRASAFCYHGLVFDFFKK